MTFSVYFKQYLSLVGWTFVLSLAFLPFEVLAPAEKQRPLGHRLFNLAYVPLLLGISILILQPISNRLATRVLLFTGGGVFANFVRPNSNFVGLLVFVVCFVLVSDVWQYWIHRLQHSIPLLWQTHRFHHSETALNSTTQARHHFLSHALSLVLYLPMLALLGAATPHFIVVFVMFRLWGFVNHMNVRLSLGPLTAIISGPQVHRIHHSIREEHRDKNFATYFPFIDILFGTYYKPAKDEYPESGLLGGQAYGSLREATIVPFLHWHRSVMRRLRGLQSHGVFTTTSPAAFPVLSKPTQGTDDGLS